MIVITTIALWLKPLSLAELQVGSTLDALNLLLG